jgi:PIN domain nuclease of toxin-antitoxin system
VIAVLDTHTWIWFLNADQRLGPHSRAAITAATTDDRAIISAITLWEIAMLVANGRLSLPSDPRDWLAINAARPGFRVHPLSVAVAVGSTTLPADPHGDPADRIIIATARHLAARLVTADRQILSYANAGHVEALDAGT